MSETLNPTNIMIKPKFFQKERKTNIRNKETYKTDIRISLKSLSAISHHKLFYFLFIECLWTVFYLSTYPIKIELFRKENSLSFFSLLGLGSDLPLTMPLLISGDVDTRFSRYFMSCVSFSETTCPLIEEDYQDIEWHSVCILFHLINTLD